MDIQSEILNTLRKEGVKTRPLKIEEVDGLIVLSVGYDNPQFEEGEIGEIIMQRFIRDYDVEVCASFS